MMTQRLVHIIPFDMVAKEVHSPHRPSMKRPTAHKDAHEAVAVAVTNDASDGSTAPAVPPPGAPGAVAGAAGGSGWPVLLRAGCVLLFFCVASAVLYMQATRSEGGSIITVNVFSTRATPANRPGAGAIAGESAPTHGGAGDGAVRDVSAASTPSTPPQRGNSSPSPSKRGSQSSTPITSPAARTRQLRERWKALEQALEMPEGMETPTKCAGIGLLAANGTEDAVRDALLGPGSQNAPPRTELALLRRLEEAHVRRYASWYYGPTHDVPLEKLAERCASRSWLLFHSPSLPVPCRDILSRMLYTAHAVLAADGREHWLDRLSNWASLRLGQAPPWTSSITFGVLVSDGGKDLTSLKYEGRDAMGRRLGIAMDAIDISSRCAGGTGAAVRLVPVGQAVDDAGMYIDLVPYKLDETGAGRVVVNQCDQASLDAAAVLPTRDCQWDMHHVSCYKDMQAAVEQQYPSMEAGPVYDFASWGTRCSSMECVVGLGHPSSDTDCDLRRARTVFSGDAARVRVREPLGTLEHEAFVKEVEEACTDETMELTTPRAVAKINQFMSDAYQEQAQECFMPPDDSKPGCSEADRRKMKSQSFQDSSSEAVQTLRSCFPVKKLSDLHLPRYRTCAVVGPSTILKQEKYSRDIDSHDAVIRVNFRDLKDMEGVAGSRTTGVVLNIHLQMQKRSPPRYFLDDPEHRFVWQAPSWVIMDRSKAGDELDELRLTANTAIRKPPVPVCFIREQSNMPVRPYPETPCTDGNMVTGKRKSYASTGYWAMVTLPSICDRVFAYGMGGANRKVSHFEYLTNQASKESYHSFWWEVGLIRHGYERLSFVHVSTDKLMGSVSSGRSSRGPPPSEVKPSGGASTLASASTSTRSDETAAQRAQEQREKRRKTQQEQSERRREERGKKREETQRAKEAQAAAAGAAAATGSSDSNESNAFAQRPDTPRHNVRSSRGGGGGGAPHRGTPESPTPRRAAEEFAKMQTNRYQASND